MIPVFLLPQHEELLRADLLIAENSLDATRQAIASNQMTNEEGKLILAAAPPSADMLRPFYDSPD